MALKHLRSTDMGPSASRPEETESSHRAEILYAYAFKQAFKIKKKLADWRDAGSQAFAWAYEENLAFNLDDQSFRLQILRYLNYISLKQSFSKDYSLADVKEADSNYTMYRLISYNYQLNKLTKQCAYCNRCKPKFGSFCCLNHRKLWQNKLRTTLNLNKGKRLLGRRHFSCRWCHKLHAIKLGSGQKRYKFCNEECRKLFRKTHKCLNQGCKVLIRGNRKKYCSMKCRQKDWYRRKKINAGRN